MKAKHLIFIVAILIVLIGAVFAKKTFIRPDADFVEYERLNINVDMADVRFIKIGKGRDKDLLVLDKVNDIWHISSKDNIRADKSRVENLIKVLSVATGELRSASERLFSDYGISDDEAISISILGNDSGVNNIDIFIGVKRSGPGTSFLRIGDSPSVYLVDKDILSILGMYGDNKDAGIDVARWQDMTIAEFDPDKVNSVKIDRQLQERQITVVDVKKEFVQEKGLSKWITIGAKPAFDIDAAKIKDFLKSINNLRAFEIIDSPDSDYGFDKPFVKVVLRTDTEPIEFLISEKIKDGTEDRYLKTSEGHIYLIRRYVVNALNIDISKFFVNNPLRISVDKLESVIISSHDNIIDLIKTQIEDNTEYINKLKKFAVKSIDCTGEYSERFQNNILYSLKIKINSADLQELDFCKAGNDKYLCKLKTSPEVFKVAKIVFNNIFENLNTLKLPVNKKEEPALEPGVEELSPKI